MSIPALASGNNAAANISAELITRRSEEVYI